MRVCPVCSTSYEEDALFCLKDGSPLTGRRAQSGLRRKVSVTDPIGAARVALPASGAISGFERRSTAEPDPPSARISDGTDSGRGPGSPIRITGRRISNGPVPAGDVVLGDVIDGRYRLIDVLGEGGMGTVFRVEQVLLGREMALKILPHEQQQDRQLVSRFMREAQAMSRLSSPHTIRVHDCGQTGSLLYLAMELLDGESLARVLDRQERLAWPYACTLLLQICESLAEAHACGVVHRDLKPENIMLVKGGRQKDFVKVLDFGLAKVSGVSDPYAVESQRDVFGTPHFMSPEQILSGTVDHRADLYALGAVAFRMLSGRHVFAELRSTFEVLSAHVSKPAQTVTEAAPDAGIPEAISQIVSGLLEKKPHRRFQSADALIGALSHVLSEFADVATQEAAPVAAVRGTGPQNIGGAAPAPDAVDEPARAPEEAPEEAPRVAVPPLPDGPGPREDSAEEQGEEDGQETRAYDDAPAIRADVERWRLRRTGQTAAASAAKRSAQSVPVVPPKPQRTSAPPRRKTAASAASKATAQTALKSAAPPASTPENVTQTVARDRTAPPRHAVTPATPKLAPKAGATEKIAAPAHVAGEFTDGDNRDRTSLEAPGMAVLAAQQAAVMAESGQEGGPKGAPTQAYADLDAVRALRDDIEASRQEQPKAGPAAPEPPVEAAPPPVEEPAVDQLEPTPLASTIENSAAFAKLAPPPSSSFAAAPEVARTFTLDKGSGPSDAIPLVVGDGPLPDGLLDADEPTALSLSPLAPETTAVDLDVVPSARDDGWAVSSQIVDKNIVEEARNEAARQADLAAARDLEEAEASAIALDSGPEGGVQEPEPVPNPIAVAPIQAPLALGGGSEETAPSAAEPATAEAAETTAVEVSAVAAPKKSGAPTRKAAGWASAAYRSIKARESGNVHTPPRQAVPPKEVGGDSPWTAKRTPQAKTEPTLYWSKVVMATKERFGRDSTETPGEARTDTPSTWRLRTPAAEAPDHHLEAPAEPGAETEPADLGAFAEDWPEDLDGFAAEWSDVLVVVGAPDSKSAAAADPPGNEVGDESLAEGEVPGEPAARVTSELTPPRPRQDPGLALDGLWQQALADAGVDGDADADPEALHEASTAGNEPLNEDSATFAAAAKAVSAAKEQATLEASAADAAESMPSAPGVAVDAAVAPDEAGSVATELNPGELIGGRFEVLRCLGRGNQGVVYAARDQDDDSEVAVKVLHPRLMGRPGVRRWLDELVATIALLETPIITPIRATGEHEDTVWLASPLLEGQTVASILAEQGQIRLRVAGRIVTKVLTALEDAHALGLAHGDLSLRNMMVLNNPAEAHFLRIMDLGLSSLLGGEDDDLLTHPCLLAPEQAMGAPLDERTDFFGLGLAIYEMLAGRAPFVADSDDPALALSELRRAHLEEEPPSLAEVASEELMPGLVALVHLLLSPAPDQRPDSVAEFRRLLSAAARGEPVVVTRGSTGAPTIRQPPQQTMAYSEQQRTQVREAIRANAELDGLARATAPVSPDEQDDAMANAMAEAEAFLDETELEELDLPAIEMDLQAALDAALADLTPPPDSKDPDTDG